MVIDDGSEDDTKAVVEEWRKEGKVQIEYYYKENGGMHTGHNLAYSKITTELNVCIDSDDFMPEDAVEKILEEWNAVEDKEKIAGIIGLDADKDGNIIGTGIPEHLKRGTLTDLYQKHKVKGDKKLVLRTDVVKEYPPYPEYEGERLVPLGILYGQMGVDYDFVLTNEVYVIVEYQEEGSSASILKQYKQSPRGFAYSRKVELAYADSWKEKMRNYIHLTSSSIFARDISLAFKGVNPVLSFFTFPFGFLLYLYVEYRIKN